MAQSSWCSVLTLEDLAEAKGFTVEELEIFGVRNSGWIVEIPYHLADGTEYSRIRLRKAVGANQSVGTGKSSSWSKKYRVIPADGEWKSVGHWLVVRDGVVVSDCVDKRMAEAKADELEDPLIPYGLYQPVIIGDTLIVPEGETDSWSLWTSGFAALGIPGANNAKCLRAEHVGPARDVHVIQEPGEAGGRFPHSVMLALHDTGFMGQVYGGPMLDGYKDPNEAFAALPRDEFVALIHRTISAMEPIMRPRPVAVALVRSSPKPVGDALLKHFAAIPDPRKYSTGNPILDDILSGGLHPGEVTGIVGKSGNGKSGLGEDWALEMSKPQYAPNNRILFMPLELRQVKSERRMLGKILKPNRPAEDWVEHLQRSLLPEDKAELSLAMDKLRSRNMSIIAPRSDEYFDIDTIMDIIVGHNPSVVIIDQVRTIAGWGIERGLMRDQVVDRDMGKLHLLAEDKGFHIVVMQQLKPVKLKKGQRPEEDDVADGAPFYQRCDTVIAVHRPFRKTDRDFVAELLVLKNRRGPEPWVHTHFEQNSISFPAMSRDEARRAICCRSKDEPARSSRIVG
jgi:hypothetical protein